MFDWLRDGLRKTSEKIAEGINSVISRGKLDKEALSNLEDVLIMADVGPETSSFLVSKIAKNRYDKEITEGEIKAALSSEIGELLKESEGAIDLSKTKKPFVILMVGVNGSGKTTTIGKLARYFSGQDLKVSMIAGDTFRAAAVEQLFEWARRTKSVFFKAKTGSDASGLIYDALNSAVMGGHDVVMIDTAGRLQNRKDLMAELQKIVRVIKKIIPEGPHLTLQVIDAAVGGNAHSQIQIFKEMTATDGIVLSKLDGTAKGGVLVSVFLKHKVPIYFIGAGEKITDIKPFKAEDYAKNLMGL